MQLKFCAWPSWAWKKTLIISGLIDEFEWPNDRRHLNSRHCKIWWGTASCILWYFIWFNIDCHYRNIRTAHSRIKKVSLGSTLVGVQAQVTEQNSDECCDIHQLYIELSYRIYFGLWFKEEQLSLYWWKNESVVNPLPGPSIALKQSLDNITLYFFSD